MAKYILGALFILAAFCGYSINSAKTIVADSDDIRRCAEYSTAFQRLNCLDNADNLDEAKRCRKIEPSDIRSKCYEEMIASVVASVQNVKSDKSDLAEIYSEKDADDLLSARKVNSNHLAERSVAASLRVGDKIITVNGMGCFRFSDNEYRCIRRVIDKAALISASNIAGITREYIDRNCFTALRAFKDPKCGFNVRFKLTAKGIDHFEQVQYYQAETMFLSHHYKH